MRLREILARTQKQSKYPATAQATIPYDRIWPDGICLANNRYTKTLQFQDINYQLAQNEDKTAIFEGWCDFLNYFDSSIHFQLSFMNLTAGTEAFEQSIAIPLRGGRGRRKPDRIRRHAEKPDGEGQQRPDKNQVSHLRR